MHGCCFLIHSATLCLLVGVFDPFTFKVIIDRYIFSNILLLDRFPLLFCYCCCCSCCCCCSSSSYSSSKPFNICHSTGLVLTNSFSFLSGELLIHPSILNDKLAG